MATEQELSKIHDLMWEAYRAGLYKKAARIAHQGVELAETAGNIRRKVSFLFWEGANLQQFDNEQAMIPLLQAATYHPEADPADTYNAMATLIEISISTRPAASTRKLLAQGRDQLRRMGKEAWRHKLDLLEGNLETASWNFQQAQVCYATAWEYVPKPGVYPYYTHAAHLYKLCQNSFQLQDKAACAEWLAEMELCDKETEKCRLLLYNARLLQQRLVGEAGEKMACLAQEVLKKTDSFEGAGTNFSALRALILCRHWPLVADRIAAAQWNENNFDDMLFRADERLLRALAALNLPMQDVELNPVLEISSLALPRSAERGQAEKYLVQAEEFYRKTMSVAEKEDERLMVSAYTETVQTRLEQVEKLQRYISEATA